MTTKCCATLTTMAADATSCSRCRLVQMLPYAINACCPRLNDFTHYTAFKVPSLKGSDWACWELRMTSKSKRQIRRQQTINALLNF